MSDTREHPGFFERILPGEADRPTLVYLHGLGESGLCFETLMHDPALAGWPQRALDMRGYGASQPAAAPLTLVEHARHLAPALQRQRTVLIGHSMGGVVATYLAPLLGRNLAGFINIEGNISAADCTYSARIAYEDRATFVAEGFGRLCDEVSADGENDAALALYAQSLRRAEPAQLHLNATELVAASNAKTLAALMGALSVETIYLLGSPRGTGPRSRELLDKAGVSWLAIPSAGHWPFIDQTSFCARTIADFSSASFLG